MFSKWENKIFKRVLDEQNSDLLTTIYRRSRFYLWYYLYAYNKGFKIRWPLAAYIVAKSIQQLAVEFIGLKNEELENFMYRGNQMIFDDVLVKLVSALNNDKLKIESEARIWDGNVLWEEQNLIQPLYKELSKESSEILEKLAKGSRFFGLPVFFAKINPLTSKHTKVNLSEFKQNLSHINHDATIPMLHRFFTLNNPKARYLHGFIVANIIFKRKVSAPKTILKSLPSDYKMTIIRKRIKYSKAHDNVRLKDEIHLLRSLLNNDFDLEKIEYVLSSIKKSRSKNHQKQKFILNYDMYFIERIAFLEVFYEERVRSLNGLLNKKIKNRYLSLYNIHRSDKDNLIYGHGLESY